jgi:oligopeptide/dipeptide ABC transporter ATP-binding protein
VSIVTEASVATGPRIPNASPSPLLAIGDLMVEYQTHRRLPPVRAIDRVSLEIPVGSTVGLVGESGSGKTTLGRAILGLTHVTSGTIAFAGQEITHLSDRGRRHLSSDLQVVFQDPYSSLNPTLSIGATLTETLRAARDLTRSQAQAEVRSMLQRVGLDPDAERRYPVEFSGGQRQRIAIARAVLAAPRLVICDEPTSSLDLSVQAQVLNLLQGLQAEMGISYLFISHNLSVVHHVSSFIVVLYSGQIMEYGDADAVYARPEHPYTQALLSAEPVPDPGIQRTRRSARRQAAAGRSVTVTGGGGCPFVPRCPYAADVCSASRPALEATPSGSLVACHRWPELPRLSGRTPA